ncbi:metal-sensing transcriptional repressor [Bacillus altitudinis]|uniref:metal-sensing transcriptional repressor n=1 Tax=Bacillus altitudinis TaxID=293387 RepID=UPI002236BE05|nr:metal-sensing transcriptional repressor [Bacillus altitudinis]MCW4359162.1 metal-sensing transcriptional repressor [Bacillus altitudinis]
MTEQEERHIASPRAEKEKEQLINRLKRVEGQVRGIQQMIENDRYCIDVVNQISAVNAALKKVSLQLMEKHTHHCVADAIKSGNGDEAIEELMNVFAKLTKS